MRMRDQVIVIIAVAIATMAVAANVFSYTQASERRAESGRLALARDWAQPVMPSRHGELPIEDSDPASTSPAVPNSMTVAGSSQALGLDTATDHAPAVACSTPDDCSDDGQAYIFEPVVAWAVAVYVSDQGYEKGIDGPPGAVEPDAVSHRERKDKNDS